jgi:hypothetical protein
MQMQQFLNDTIADYYEQNEGVEFLEKVEMLHTLKTLDEEQLESLQETIALEINYEHIIIEEYLDRLSQKNNSEKYSFIDPRPKKTNQNDIYLWGILVVLSSVIVLGVLNYQSGQNDQIETTKKIEKAKPTEVKKSLDKVAVQVAKKEPVVAQKVEQPQEKVEEKKVVVLQPDHSIENTKSLQTIFMLFDVVPYDAVLKDLEISKDSSTFVCNFVANTTSLEDMQTKLKNIYKESKVLLRHQNGAVLNTIIENNTPLPNDLTSGVSKNIEYEKSEFLTTIKAIQLLEELTPEDSIVKFIAQEQKEYTTYNFTVKSTVKDPQEFFDFVEALSTQKISMNISLPVLFTKVNSGLEIKYNIQLNQENKK